MNGLSKRGKLVAAFATVGILAIAAVSIRIAVGSSTNADTPVVFYDSSAGGNPAQTEFQTADAATAEASRRAGFSVKVPPYLPPGFSVADVTISPKPPAASQSTLRRILFAIKRGNATLTMIAVNSPFTFPGSDDPSKIVATPVKGANIYKSTGDGLVEYTLLTPTRGYVLGFKAAALSEAEALKILSSLPME